MIEIYQSLGIKMVLSASFILLLLRLNKRGLKFVLGLSFTVLMLCCVKSEATVELSGTVIEDGILRLNCSSKNKPQGCRAEFLVNNTTWDVVAYVRQGCYSVFGKCHFNTCACSSTCKSFTLLMSAPVIKDQIISCRMRLRRQGSRIPLYVQRSGIVNGTVFKQHKYNIPLSRLPPVTTDVPAFESDVHFQDFFFNANTLLTLLVVVCMMAIVGMISFVIVYYAKNRASKSNTKELKQFGSLRERDADGSINLTISLESPDAIESTDSVQTQLLYSDKDSTMESRRFEVKQPSYSSTATKISHRQIIICDSCGDETSFSFCFQCRKIYCLFCLIKHKSEFKDHTVCLMETPSIGFMKCERCSKNHSTLICIRCRLLLCRECKYSCFHEKDSSYLRGISQQINAVQPYSTV